MNSDISPERVASALVAWLGDSMDIKIVDDFTVDASVQLPKWLTECAAAPARQVVRVQTLRPASTPACPGQYGARFR